MAKVYIAIISLDSANGAIRNDAYKVQIGSALIYSQLVGPDDSLAFIELKYKSPQDMQTTWRDLINAVHSEPLYIFLDSESLKPAQQYAIMRSFEQAAVSTPFNPTLNIATLWRAEVLHNSFLIDRSGISTLMSQKMFAETMKDAVEKGLLSAT